MLQIPNAIAFAIGYDRAAEYVQVLREQSRPVKNDWRQHNYCKYITNFASHFGKERCLVVGSTKEGTRLRSRLDEGDYDYLIISDVFIPAEALEYRKEVPCFVHINVEKIQHNFSNASVIDGKYLNTRLLKGFDDSVFKILRGIYDVLTMPSLIRSYKGVDVKVNKEVKPGYNQVHFSGFEYEDGELGYVQVQADIQAIKEQFRHLLARSDISEDMISVLSNSLSLIEELRPEDISNSLTFQTFGALIEAASGETLSSLYGASQKEDFCDGDTCNPDKMKTDDEQGNLDTKLKEYITIHYDYKSGRDFIPAFPIKGKLQCLDEWRNRLLESVVFWPSREIIDQIYGSEYFAIAKPAIINSQINKDFCIGFNNAEMILASSFSDGQRVCFLLLKSLQKGFLKQYSERLTTYHWKSAFYHVSETTETDLFTDTAGIFLVLEKVINYMISCLEKRFLRHYFIKSNLIAHFSEEESHRLSSAIKDILLDPVKTLDVYFSSRENDGKLTDHIPNEQLGDLKHQEGDSSRATHAESIVSLISRLQQGTGNDSTKFVEAVIDTLALVVQAEANFDCNSHDLCRGILKVTGDFLNTKFRTTDDRKTLLKVIAPIFLTYQSQSFG